MMKNNPGWVGDDGEMNKSSITSFYTGNLPNESEFANVKENNQENVDDPNVAEAGLTGLPNLRETIDAGKSLLDKVGDSKVGKFLKKYTPGEEEMYLLTQNKMFMVFKNQIQQNQKKQIFLMLTQKCKLQMLCK